MTGIVQSLIGTYSAAVSAVTDAYFYLVTLLLNTTTTNGAQNNTFLDSSSNNFTITRNGNTTQGTFTPFSLTGWGQFFNGSTDYETVADNAALQFGSGDFTVEGWVYLTAATDAVGVISKRSNSTFTGTDWRIAYRSATAKLAWADPGSGNTDYNTPAITLNTWTHFAFVRSGTSLRCYANGVLGDTATVSTNFTNTQTLYIAANTTSLTFPGYLSNIRITKGGALYSGSTYTVPTSALTTTVSAGTVSLLTCQSNRFIDNSSNAFSITVAGTPRVQAFEPFAPGAAYSTSVVGGSGYFDGTGDYLSIADNVALQFGSGNFTINCWIYRSVSGAVHTIASKGASTPTGWVFQVNASNQLVWTDTSTNITTTTTIPANAWTYVSVVRSGTGTNQTVLYINGVSSATGTSATNFNQTSALNIGADRSNANTFNGYIAGFEYVKGTALSISIPSSPPTTSNSPSALLNFTNAGIYDATSKNDLETVGNAQVSTTQAKFGTTSMSFDGTGDYLTFPSNDLLAFGTGDFTIEFWVYRNNTTSNMIVIDSRPAAGTDGYAIYFDSNNKTVWLVANVATATGATTISSGAWYHIAVTRSGTTVKIFVNGAQDASVTSATDAKQSGITIGAKQQTGSSLVALNGYLDEFRITKGYARYTSAFSVPTAAFPVQ